MLTWWGIVQSLFCIGLFSCSMNWFVYVFSVPWEEDVKIVTFGKTTSWVTLHVSLGIWVVSPQVYFFGHLGKVVTITFTFVNAHFCFMLLLKICCCSSCLSRGSQTKRKGSHLLTRSPNACSGRLRVRAEARSCKSLSLTLIAEMLQNRSKTLC